MTADEHESTPWWEVPLRYKQHCTIHGMALVTNAGAAGGGCMWVTSTDNDERGPDRCDGARDDFGQTCMSERLIHDKVIAQIREERG